MSSSKSSINPGQCDLCGSLTSELNREGLLVCASCGYVLDDSPIQVYHRPRKNQYDKYGTLSHAVSNSSQIGNIKERVTSKDSGLLIRLNRLNSILDHEEVINTQILKESRRILVALGLSEKLQNGIVEISLGFYKQIKERTKFRGPEKLVPISIYLACLQKRVNISIPELVKVSSISSVDFKRGLKLILTLNKELYHNLRSDKFRKEHILLILSGMHSLFKLPDAFLSTSRDILNSFWRFLKKTQDSVVAGLVYHLSRVYLSLASGTDEWKGLYTSRICDFIGIEQSTINANVERFLFTVLDHKLSRTPRVKVTKEVLSRLYFEDNYSYDELAQHFQCSVSNIYYYVKKYKIPLKTEPKSKQEANLDKEEIRRMYWDDKLRISEIAEEKGVNPGVIQYFMNKAGIPRRNRGRQK